MNKIPTILLCGSLLLGKVSQSLAQSRQELASVVSEKTSKNVINDLVYQAQRTVGRLNDNGQNGSCIIDHSLEISHEIGEYRFVLDQNKLYSTKTVTNILLFKKDNQIPIGSLQMIGYADSSLAEIRLSQPHGCKGGTELENREIAKIARNFTLNTGRGENFCRVGQIVEVSDSFLHDYVVFFLNKVTNYKKLHSNIDFIDIKYIKEVEVNKKIKR